uniref:Predicted protein n=1 Tax=Hordeum vulgare subsp. vulgare TaxID=112509 RepID=F2E2W6_HORVV|nr:predicted protein [Hordeum vulgare subsp. vulgare]
MTDPQETDCCYECFCKGCIEKSLTISRVCPKCRRKVNGHRENVKLKRMISNLKLRCSNEGCNEVITRGIQAEHKNKCLFELVSCSHSLSCNKMLRKERDKHETTECPKRPTKCAQCSTTISFYRLTDHINNTCKEVIVSCTQECGEIHKRKDLAKHISSQCPKTVVDCVFKSLSCLHRCARSDLSSHDNSPHSNMIMAKIISQDKDIESLKRENEILKKEIRHLSMNIKIRSRGEVMKDIFFRNILPLNGYNCIHILDVEEDILLPKKVTKSTEKKLWKGGLTFSAYGTGDLVPYLEMTTNRLNGRSSSINYGDKKMGGTDYGVVVSLEYYLSDFVVKVNDVFDSDILEEIRGRDNLSKIEIKGLLTVTTNGRTTSLAYNLEEAKSNTNVALFTNLYNRDEKKKDDTSYIFVSMNMRSERKLQLNRIDIFRRNLEEEENKGEAVKRSYHQMINN